MQNKTYRKEFIHDARMEFLDEAMERNHHLEFVFHDEGTEYMRNEFLEWIKHHEDITYAKKQSHALVQSSKSDNMDPSNLVDVFKNLKTNLFQQFVKIQNLVKSKQN